MIENLQALENKFNLQKNSAQGKLWNVSRMATQEEIKKANLSSCWKRNDKKVTLLSAL